LFAVSKVPKDSRTPFNTVASTFMEKVHYWQR